MCSTEITSVSTAPRTTLPVTTEDIAHFQTVRPHLFQIAYRMLGRVADAEDVVQEAWLRWQGTDRALVRDRNAYLVRITTRLTLNLLDSARARREIPVDSQFPEQLVASDVPVPAAEDPAVVSERAADLEPAISLLLQRLSPMERAVFVLREAFEYPFRDIAEALRTNEAHARQLGRRARERMCVQQQHKTAGRLADERLLTAFLHAAQAGAMAQIEQVLTDDTLVHTRERRRPLATHRARHRRRTNDNPKSSEG
ncbi:sigma-70 family RNA polymerase sigma factor [Lentzea jiangxiensis]|uniref:RNA polymerase sigma-70 factor, ECF subfamily n=1 Tax=Lentzea jiangxiensis TaxID=641025 RepID=A0A1H0WD32_9PSEU|nr:sigma-70 family RNA polymerase sigma factor [Lentzea jiangxiensis]SDP88660.1 RNA polymerase sigma-70 factor, ECF subfamily [Lentzea jiangxiensis]